MHYLSRILFLLLTGLALSVQAADTADSYKVLCYHNVLDDPLADPEKFTVRTAELVQQFSWLKEHGYSVISVTDLLDAREGKRPLPPKAVMLTFDDGYRSFYTHVYPLLQAYNYSAVLAIVGSWLQLDPGQKVPYEGHNYSRSSFLSAREIQEMSDSGLVEIASHSFDLHRGIRGNPQGNLQPAAITRTYSPETKSYETDEAYLARIKFDLSRNNAFIESITGKNPRVMVWPYGRYNQPATEVAQALGMSIMLNLDDGTNTLASPLWQITRSLIAYSTSIPDLAEELNPTPRSAPERVMQVDLDYVYDPDPAQQEKNLGMLLDRVKAMSISTVYLQAFADPDGDGAADSLYFPNQHLPMRADLFNRVSWQLQTRAGVKVYAWMPLLAFDLPKSHPLSQRTVVSVSPKNPQSGYPRLTPFDEQTRQLIAGVYEDLAKHAAFDGILFHDDAMLDDFEDASPWALAHYQKEWGFPASVPEIRGNPELFNSWSSRKTQFLTGFSLDLAKIVRRYQPRLKTARNIYAEVVLNPKSEEWFAQSFPVFLDSYDYTALMAMPFMENAQDPQSWLETLVDVVARQPNGLKKTLFELQSVDWRNSQPVDSRVMAGQMIFLQKHGALNFGYYPDNFLNDSPRLDIIRPAFSLQEFPFTGKTE
ncbi:MAG: poly-beta-1,6-N-acetyl-D-glucosamine N-deacetylase PgaB [Gammaproteobacteria bacterium]|nr:poly-beta-1,6-N-acetyl-D-glucosamine N-deacetylase PgaB [Gammaproteobacteria bacterium]MBU1777377.1 poly-beta-1,6-N-acetyl-D-glucosamine N-deacetylase PgaB [Gammaproteobacteria bacterium]